MIRCTPALRSGRLWILLACLGFTALIFFYYHREKLADTVLIQRPKDTGVRQIPETASFPHHPGLYNEAQRKVPPALKPNRTLAPKPPPMPRTTARRITERPTTKKKTTTTTTTTTKAPIVTVVKIPDTKTLNAMSHLQLHKFYHSKMFKSTSTPSSFVPVADIGFGDHPPPNRYVLRHIVNQGHADDLSIWSPVVEAVYVNSPQVPCSAVERMGHIQDGGWEMCDDPLYRPDKTDCLVYSFGINYDFSFDDDIAEYGCEVYAFDPSMMRSQDHIRGERIHFFKLGVGDHDHYKINGNNGQWTLYSLKGLRDKFGHKVGQRRIDIVKMDVEGHEMESLTQALKDRVLDDVRQLSFETHVTWGPTDATKEQYIKFLELLRGVYDAGFRIYATHRNHVWSHFRSALTGKERVKCHEIQTVNINLRQKPSRESRFPESLSVRRVDAQQSPNNKEDPPLAKKAPLNSAGQVKVEVPPPNPFGQANVQAAPLQPVA